MGILSGIFNFISSIDGVSYIRDAKDWGDNVWNDMGNACNGTLMMNMIDKRLYKQLRLEFNNGTVGLFIEKNDCGCSRASLNLTELELQQLREEGYITIKRY